MLCMQLAVGSTTSEDGVAKRNGHHAFAPWLLQPIVGSMLGHAQATQMRA